MTELHLPERLRELRDEAAEMRRELAELAALVKASGGKQ